MDSASTAAGTAAGSISVDRLTLERAGRVLFSDMTWQIMPGTLMAVTGPSGAGKSSLLACLNGGLMPNAGSIDIAGGSSVGTVFQHLRLTEELSVLTNVLCGRLGAYAWWQTLFGFSSEAKAEAFAIIESLGLETLVHKPVKQISGGEKQRTAIARVLFQQPRVILADEPTAHLDNHLATRVLESFRGLCRNSGTAAVVVLHDHSLVNRFADVQLEIGADTPTRWRLEHL